MKLQEIYDLYQSSKLEKHDYIKIMHQKHSLLFDYFDYIKDSDVESITIDNEKMYLTLKDTNIKLLLDRHDSRFIPIEILNFHSPVFYLSICQVIFLL